MYGRVVLKLKVMKKPSSIKKKDTVLFSYNLLGTIWNLISWKCQIWCRSSTVSKAILKLRTKKEYEQEAFWDDI